MVELIKLIGSEWVGVTLDFGNNISLLENPMEVIKTLAPYSFSTHVKDMGVQEYEKGFLLSEVPLGQGIVDLPAAVALCKKLNPRLRNDSSIRNRNCSMQFLRVIRTHAHTH